MNQTNQPTQSNNPLTNDYLVTKQVNPTTISSTQLKNDLDALKKAEDILTPKQENTPILSKPLSRPNNVKQETTSDTPQELIALQVKNPFTGE